MFRSRSTRITLTLLAAAFFAAAVPTQAQLSGPDPSPPATTSIPLANLENWSVLSLQEGLLFTRTGGAPDGPYFVFAGAADNNQSQFLVYHGDVDAAAAFGALHEELGLSKADFYTLQDFALGAELKATGQWDPLTLSEGYLIAADPAMGQLGTKLYDALLLLEAGNFAGGVLGLNTAVQVQNPVPIDICNVRKTTAAQATASQVPGGPVAIHATTPSSAGAFPLVQGATTASQSAYTAAQLCAASGTPPAFPVLPGYPTVTVPWEKQPCSPVGSTTTSGCIQSSTGNYCTQCTCQQLAGGGGGWRPSGNCTPVTSTPVGTACAPVGGTGPCTSGTTACSCTCDTATPPATGGVWGHSNCGSPALALIFALAAGILVWHRHNA